MRAMRILRLEASWVIVLLLATVATYCIAFYSREESIPEGSVYIVPSVDGGSLSSSLTYEYDQTQELDSGMDGSYKIEADLSGRPGPSAEPSWTVLLFNDAEISDFEVTGPSGRQLRVESWHDTVCSGHVQIIEIGPTSSFSMSGAPKRSPFADRDGYKELQLPLFASTLGRVSANETIANPSERQPPLGIFGESESCGYLETIAYEEVSWGIPASEIVTVISGFSEDGPDTASHVRPEFDRSTWDRDLNWQLNMGFEGSARITDNTGAQLHDLLFNLASAILGALISLIVTLAVTRDRRKYPAGYLRDSDPTQLESPRRARQASSKNAVAPSSNMSEADHEIRPVRASASSAVSPAPRQGRSLSRRARHHKATGGAKPRRS